MTAFFTLFVFMGIFNAFNARTERYNLLYLINKNKMFIMIFMFVCLIQIIFIYYGGSIFRTYGLTFIELAKILLISLFLKGNNFLLPPGVTEFKLTGDVVYECIYFDGKFHLTAY